MKKASPFFSKILKLGIALFFVFVTSLCLLEIAYRYQIVDFYKVELKALNPDLNKDFPNGNVLIFGDSFSGFPNGYVEQLRKGYPKTNFINCAISGTGIRQHALFFEDRIEEFKPKKIVYQFYLGNDLLDIHQDLRFERGNFLRAYYVFLSDQFLVLKYINYKFAGFKRNSIKPGVSNSNLDYNPRVKKQFFASENYLTETINIKGSQAQKFDEWFALFNSMNKNNKANLTVLALPHCAQVHYKYSSKMETLGAVLDKNIFDQQYPLITKLHSKLNNVKVLNPLLYFQKEEKTQALYFTNDPHLNEYGQFILGQFLIEKKLFNEN